MVPKEQFQTFTVKKITRGDVSKGQTRLDRVEARVIANAEGVDVLFTYSAANTVIIGDEGEDDSGSDNDDGATTVVRAKG